MNKILEIDGSAGFRYAWLALTIITAFPAFVTAQIGINMDYSPPDSSAILDLKSTTQGFLTPRMTQAERDAISNPDLPDRRYSRLLL